MQCAITDMQAQEGEGSRGESQTIPARPGPGVGFCKTGLSVLKKKKKREILATPGQLVHSGQRSGTASKQRFSLSRVLRNN